MLKKPIFDSLKDLYILEFL
ncbi:MAG TPA: hypothetical protein EYN62_02805 [Gammaproteobacteria bacterium]|nr:hypothetical protein [Gammaproteobacteria bacterium]